MSPTDGKADPRMNVVKQLSVGARCYPWDYPLLDSVDRIGRGMSEQHVLDDLAAAAIHQIGGQAFEAAAVVVGQLLLIQTYQMQ